MLKLYHQHLIPLYKVYLVFIIKVLISIDWNNNDTLLISGSDDHTITLWDIRQNIPVNRLIGHYDSISCCKFNNISSNLIFTSSFDETCRIWDVRRPEKSIRVINAHSDPLTSIDITYDDNILITSSYDGLCRLWNIETGECIKTIYSEKVPSVGYCSFTPNSQYIITNTFDSTIRLWNYKDYEDNGTCEKIYQGHVNKNYAISSNFLILNKNNPIKDVYLISGSEDHNIYIWKINQEEYNNHKNENIIYKPILVENRHENIVLSIDSYPLQQHEAIFTSAGLDGKIITYKLRYI